MRSYFLIIFSIISLYGYGQGALIKFTPVGKQYVEMDHFYLYNEVLDSVLYKNEIAFPSDNMRLITLNELPFDRLCKWLDSNQKLYSNPDKDCNEFGSLTVSYSIGGKEFLITLCGKKQTIPFLEKGVSFFSNLTDKPTKIIDVFRYYLDAISSQEYLDK